MTLISVGGHEGETGRCDEKCYNATQRKCTCCCGGMNHGKGLKAAMDTTSRYAENIIERWELEHPEETVRIRPAQLELFT